LGYQAFIDSSAFFAYIVPADDHYQDAIEILGRCQRQAITLATSNFIVAETHGLLLNRVGYATAATFLRNMGASTIEIIRAEPADEVAASEIIYRYADKRFSMVDAISFAMMRRLGIDHAFAFDRNFSQFGLMVLQA
jgi:predicted nucleic acid-binding protein